MENIRNLRLVSNIIFRKQFNKFISRVCNGRKVTSVQRQVVRRIFQFFTPTRVTICAIPVVHVLGSGITAASSMAGKEEIIKKADELYTKNEVDQLYEHLISFKESTDPDILWRLARATCDLAKSNSDKTKRKELMYQAFGYAEQALKHGNEVNFACHKWYAIMLDYIGEYEGTKSRVSNAYKIKDNFLKAIELNEKDATSVHLLGYWCFVFADLPWYQQKAASVIFATPPTSTYQEALDYFLKAEKIDPGFYSMNLLMIGKTYLRLKDNTLAKDYLTKARDYPVHTEDDKKAHKEAVELLQSI